MARTDFRSIWRKRIAGMKAALLCGAAALLLTSQPSPAQEAGLRRTIDTDALSNSVLQDQNARAALKKKKPRRLSAGAGLPLPQYRPSSADGFPDEPAQDEAAAPAANPFDDPVTQSSSPSQTNAPSPPDGASARGEEPAAIDRELTSEIPVPGEPSDGEALDAPLKAERDNQRETAIEGRSRAPEEDPYAAPGIQAGAFTLRPTLETGLRWTSNSDGSANGAASVLSETALRLRAQSNWSRHRLGFEANGNWRRSLSGAQTNDPEAGLAADFQLDLPERAALTGALGWTHSIEAASAPAAVTGALSQPTLDSLTGSLAISRDIGRIRLSARANGTRAVYGSATDAAGLEVSQSDRDNSYAGLTLRAGYEVSPALRPFIEGEIGRRFFDNAVDSFGLERSATRMAVRAGVETDLGEKLRGDIAIGYLREDIEDAALEDIAGLSLAGTLNWSPMRGTSAALTASTSVEGSSTATSSGSLLHGLSLALTHRARSNLDLNANLGASLRDYTGPNPNEITLSAGLGFTYWFNRYVGLSGRAAHETVLSGDDARRIENQFGLCRADLAQIAYLAVTRRSSGRVEDSSSSAVMAIWSCKSGRHRAKARLASTNPSFEPQSNVRPLK